MKKLTGSLSLTRTWTIGNGSVMMNFRCVTSALPSIWYGITPLKLSNFFAVASLQSCQWRATVLLLVENHRGDKGLLPVRL